MRKTRKKTQRHLKNKAHARSAKVKRRNKRQADTQARAQKHYEKLTTIQRNV